MESTITLINQLRIKRLWINVETYNIIIRIAKEKDMPELALLAAEAKMKTLDKIQEIYRDPTAI